MKRKIDSILDDWLKNRKQAILLFGARQVGKTHSLRECFNRNGAPYVEINFGRNKIALELFAKLKDENDFYVKLSLVCKGQLKEGKTFVFLDEIQEVYNYRRELEKKDPELYFSTVDPITLIKGLVEENRFRYALSGSLLGINLSGIASNPVGYLDSYTMYPMDFEEFLWANGVGAEAISYLKEKFEKLEKMDETIHQSFLDFYRRYVLVGGMPEAVATYCDSKNIAAVQTVQKQILKGYRADIQKYAPVEQKLLIAETFDNIPNELNRKDKHFRKSNLDYPDAKNLDLGDAFLWLTNAGVALPVYNVSEPVYPLRLNEQRKTLKLFSNDIGLLCSQLVDRDGAIKIIEGDSSLNFGAPYENVVAQELFAHFEAAPHYLNSKKYGEIDFLIQRKGEVLPLEIKSGSPNKNGLFAHKALDNVLGTYPNIKKAYVLSQGNIAKEGKNIVLLPFYMSMFLCA